MDTQYTYSTTNNTNQNDGIYLEDALNVVSAYLKLIHMPKQP